MKITRKKTMEFIVFSLIVLPLIEPRGIIDMASTVGGVWSIIDNLFSLLLYVSIFLSMTMIGSKIKSYKPTPLVWMTSAYHLIFMLSCIVNGNFSYYTFFISVRAIYVALLCDYFFQRKKTMQLISVFSLWISLFVIINILTIIIFKNGMYMDNRGWYTKNFFLGNKNVFLYSFIPCLAFAAVFLIVKHGKLTNKYYVLLAIMIVSCVLTTATTATISIVIFAILLFFFERITLPKWITPEKIFIIFTFITFAFLYLNFQEAFNNILLRFFSKDSSFTSRPYIWGQAIQQFRISPIIGRGNIIFSLSSIRSWTTGQAHNKYLDILSTTGILGYVLYFRIMYLCGKSLLGCRENKFKNILLFLIVCYCILFLMEARREDSIIFAVLFLAYHINNILDVNHYNSKIRKVRPHTP